VKLASFTQTEQQDSVPVNKTAPSVCEKLFQRGLVCQPQGSTLSRKAGIFTKSCGTWEKNATRSSVLL